MGEITWGTAAATLAAPLVFFLPGWALLSLLLPRRSFDPGQRPDGASWLLLAAGTTLSLIPVLILVLHFLGIKAGTVLVLSLLALSAIVVLWTEGLPWYATWRRERSWRSRLAGVDRPLLFLGILAVLILGVRLWVIRGINVGFWGDSYHHTMIVQLLLDNGGLFQSWEPYVPLESFAYHYGFHADAAFFQWATGWFTANATPRTVVLVGQFLNTLAVLALVPLAIRLGRGNRWVGVVAILVAGLLTPMPMYYVNWGRYTQLAGQIILPGAVWFTMETMEHPRWDPRRIALAALSLAGLAITHYRILAIYVGFLVPYVPYLLWTRRQARSWAGLGLRLTATGMLAIIMAVPWMWNLWKGFYAAIVSDYTQQAAPTTWIAEYNAIGSLDQFAPYSLIVLAGIGGLYALWRRQPMALVVPWVGACILLTNPYLVGVPGTGLISNFTIALALYMPVALLVGLLVGGGLAWLAARRPAALWVTGGVLLLTTLWGLRAQAQVLEPSCQLVTASDEQAMSWIRENTPPDSRFLVNGFFAFNDSLVVGSDGGWWIPLLTGRRNTIPPILYALEASPIPGYREKVNALTREIETRALSEPATAQFLRGQGIGYVYVGEKGGALLDVGALSSSPLYREVYHQDSVWIFEVQP